MISERLKRSLKSEFKRSLLAKVGLALVVGIIVVAIFAPIFAPHDPQTQRVSDDPDVDRTDLPPVGYEYSTSDTRLEDGEIISEETTVEGEWTFPLGTNTLGQDILSRIMYGARVSMAVGIVGSLLAVLIGVPYGLAAGYYGGRVDDGLMRGADVMLAFPSLVLAIALVGVFRDSGFHTTQVPDPLVYAARHDTIGWLVPRADHVATMPESITFPVTVTIVVALVNWVWFARVARGEAMSLRQQEFIKGAKAVGASNARIIRQHVLPNSVTPVIVLATIQVAAIILLESALSYLGFSETTLTWGYDIQQGEDSTRREWWIPTMPGLAIVLAVIGVNLLGDWLRDALDPSIEGEGGV